MRSPVCSPARASFFTGLYPSQHGIHDWLGEATEAYAAPWLRDPTLAKSDYVGTIDVSAADAKLYRAVPFEWRVNSAAGSFTGTDTAFVRVDPSGERPVICGWLRLDKAGQSIRATRWLSARSSLQRASCNASAATNDSSGHRSGSAGPVSIRLA